MLNKLLTVNEVAKLLRVSNMTIYRLVKSGSMNAVRVGHSYRIDKSDIERYLKKNKMITNS